ncbi:MAG: MoaD/ThiS family protein [Rubrivivax sp.]
MKIHVRYFASLREALGPQETADVPAGCTVTALRLHLGALSDRHQEALAPGRALRCALDQRMCAEDAVLSEGVEVAFFPPVTGG